MKNKYESSATVSQIMQEAIGVSQKAFGDSLRQVWLFGSYARGEANEDSDIDFCVVLSKPVDTWRYIDTVYSDFTMDILSRYGELPSVFITNEEKFLESNIPVYEMIKKEGVQYYAV